jgi:hypothetical protein
VGRAVLEEAVVVGVFPLAPAAFGVVAGLLGEEWGLFRVEVDRALGVGVALGLIQDVHGQSVGRGVLGGRPPSM